MTGIIVQTSLGCISGRREPAGGEIRSGEIRIRFEAPELMVVRLPDALGMEVDFDYVAGKACRVRPRRVDDAGNQ